MQNLFRYDDYKVFLNELTEAQGTSFGLKAKLADAAGCTRSFFSQVLKSHTHLTPEHAIKIADYLELKDYAKDYFYELVNFSRAGEPSLKNHIKSRLKNLKQQNEDFIQRFQASDLINTSQKAIYYSGWQYAAIHVILSIPQFRTPKAISDRLGLSQEYVYHILTELEDQGFIAIKNGTWEVLNYNIHLPRDSNYTEQNHLIWRMKAIENSKLKKPEDIHFTAVYSLSKLDVEKLRTKILEFIDDSRDLVASSAEEDMISITIDLFRP